MVIRKIELQILRLRVTAFCLFVMEGSTDLRFDHRKTRARRVEPSSLSPPVFSMAAGSTAGKELAFPLRRSTHCMYSTLPGSANK